MPDPFHTQSYLVCYSKKDGEKAKEYCSVKAAKENALKILKLLLAVKKELYKNAPLIIVLEIWCAWENVWLIDYLKKPCNEIYL